jgi:nucleoid DNA-binding protein
MTKKDIAKKIAEATGVPQMKVAEIVQMLFDGITEILVEEGNIEFRNFGVFKVKKRKARPARNPRTGEAVTVPSRRTITFKPGREPMKRVARVEAANNNAWCYRVIPQSGKAFSNRRKPVSVTFVP